ncbi:MAG: glycosyltransferase family 4 protein [Bacteroidetes bacterium]|nr:glycosyltransferase family 4 protein [Bacteroidota bacterium]
MSAKRPRILFLSAYPQPFLLSGIRKLCENHNADVLVLHWPTPDESPTQIDLYGLEVEFLNKNNVDITQVQEQLENFAPDIVYAAGWMDKDYLRLCRQFKNAGKTTVMGMDTQWKGTLKQYLNCLLAPFTLKSAFAFAWVPGQRQYEYARKLGFDKQHILQHLYALDTSVFGRTYERYLAAKADNYPKTFLYAGRLVAHKFGSLLRAFSSLSEDEREGWKLIVAGKGPMEHHQEMKNETIVYKGFLQYNELAELVAEAGVFCLTSTEEPWGMVIQEFAAGGLPLIVSKQCGAAGLYLKDGENGYLCNGNDVAEIKTALLKMIGKSKEELLQMGEESTKLASADNSAVWADELISVL